MLRVAKLVIAIAVLVLLPLGQHAKADFITGQITGVFTSSGTNVYSQNGVTITFTGLGPGTIETPTFASFGNFDVVSAPIGPVAVVDTFTLTLSESAPDVDSVSFTGLLAGLLGQNQSSASLTFAQPLSKLLANRFTVSVLSADQGSAGRVNLGVPSFPNASIAGSIVSVPEPGSFQEVSLALLGLGLVYGIGYRFRH